MKKLRSIAVPEPCHENWYEVTPKEKGRYCDSCAKVVVDFTGHTQQEIYDEAESADGQICGHFNLGQLGVFRSESIVEKRRLSFLRKFVAAALVVFGTSLFVIPDTAVAQQIDTITTSWADTNARGEVILNNDTLIWNWFDAGVADSNVVLEDIEWMIGGMVMTGVVAYDPSPLEPDEPVLIAPTPDPTGSQQAIQPMFDFSRIPTLKQNEPAYIFPRHGTMSRRLGPYDPNTARKILR